MQTNFYNIQRQQGAVLLMSLVLLIVLTLLGISALDSTKLETKMAANIQENHTAFQAANAGLDQAYHHYVFQGKTNDFKDLKDFPDNEWNDEGVKIMEKSSAAGLKFDNHATTSLRVKKIVVPDTSQLFFILESKGNTGCIDGECNGHEVTLIEGWSFKGAKGTNEYYDAQKRCLTESTDACQQIFANIATCADSSCLPNVNDSLATCSANADGIPLSPDCPRIFSAMLNP